MKRGEVRLPHFAFFEALAAMDDETSAEWRVTSAGLVTIRLFDAWMHEGPTMMESEAWSVRAVRGMISEIDPGNSIRALLTSIVDSMEQARDWQVSVVAPRLMAYARALQFDAKWSLAADVYKTISDNLDPLDDADVVIAANLQRGACLRMLARWEDALASYGEAARIARTTGDIMNELRSMIAEANVALDRGNIPAAEAMLDEAIVKATEHDLTEIQAFALQDRGIVARRRGDFDKSIRCTYEALKIYEDQAAKDRALADLAVTFYDMGLLSAAREANLMLAATASEQYTRWVATVNLLEIAARDRREPVFEQYRRELAQVTLPVTLQAYYYYYVGQGYRMFDKPEQAKAALQRALDFATHHHVNEVIIKAEQSLNEIRDGEVIRVAKAPEPSPTVSKVASAIREMRTHAGVIG